MLHYYIFCRLQFQNEVVVHVFLCNVGEEVASGCNIIFKGSESKKKFQIKFSQLTKTTTKLYNNPLKVSK